jgi:co-chaperonin GroES (HSP10)
MRETLEFIAKEIEPFNQQIVMVQDIESSETEAGLVISEGARAKYRSGIVAAVAGDCKLPIKVGDRLGWQKFAGSELQIKAPDGKKYAVILIHEQSLTMRVLGESRLDGGNS